MSLRSRIALASTLTAAVAAIFLPAAAQAAFAPAVNYNVGTQPYSVAIGNLNSDAYPDLAVANGATNNVSILLGSASGTFGAASNFSTGANSNPRSVAIGDFNSDGFADLATANYNPNKVSILLGDGTGSFGPATNFSTQTGPSSVVVGQFDSDEFADLAVANRDANSLSVLLGDGNGSFGSPVDLATDDGPVNVTTGDFNGDGATDLASANVVGSNISVFLGDGAGSFGSATEFASGGTGTHSVASADLNGDGDSDLVAVNVFSDNVAVLFGDGSGAFGTPATYSGVDGPLSVAISDLSGDGVLDLAVAASDTSYASVFYGNGTGTYGTPEDNPVGTGPYSIAAGDLNGDGLSDLVTANEVSGNASVLLFVPAASATPPSLAFGIQPLGVLSKAEGTIITNDRAEGGDPLDVSRVRTVGADASDFIVASDACTGESIAPSDTCQVKVRFAPDSPGAKSASLEIAYDFKPPWEPPVLVPLAGRGGPYTGRPSIESAAKPGKAAIRLRVSCAGDLACRVRFSGRLKGGAGTLRKKTVDVPAGETITARIRYSRKLISGLRIRGGGTIHVKAKQVGGSTSSINVKAG